jgi:hypothetical protein
MAALAAPTAWLERRVRVELRRMNGAANGVEPGRRARASGGNGALKEDGPAGLNRASRTRENGSPNGDELAGLNRASRGSENGSPNGDESAGLNRASRGSENGSPTGDESAGLKRASRGSEDGSPMGDAAAAFAFLAGDGAVRRSARALHAACAELLPGYVTATREPWRQALLTAGCLDARPRRAAPRSTAPALIVADVVQPSDVLCALWLARRSGLFSPGSPCGDGVGLRSACEIVPEFVPSVTEERRAGVLEALRANAAWRAHLLARAAA